MKRLIALMSLFVHGIVLAAYDPFEDCAEVEIKLCVMDERGVPVQGANLIVAYQVAPEKGEAVKGKTDAQGLFRTSGRCNSIVNIEVSKSGFYGTHIRKSVAEAPVGEVVATRRWTRDALPIRVVLKTVRQPERLIVHSVDFKPYPATNEVLKLDLETLEWCPPYGNGKHDDLHLVFDGWRNPSEWLDFHENLSVSLPNCVDGFYLLKLEAQSEFPYAYAANANAVYEKSLELRHKVKPTGRVESVTLAQDEYLIFRVRTQTNELGQVTHAHYGRIGEKFSQYIGLSVKSWFNPTDNDTNLEDSRTK